MIGRLLADIPLLLCSMGMIASGRIAYIAAHKNNSCYAIQSGNLDDCYSLCAWLPALPDLYFSLLGHFQSVLDLNTQITHGAFKLSVTQQKLNCPQILRPFVNQGSLGSP